jgi:hypothetical protein
MNHMRKENAAGADGKLALGRGALTSDAELVQAAPRGDKRAFVEIVARHQAMVCGGGNLAAIAQPQLLEHGRRPFLCIFPEKLHSGFVGTG